MDTNSEFHIIEKIFTIINELLSNYVNDSASRVIEAIQPIAYTLIAIYIMFWGWSMIRGLIQEPVTDGLTRMIRITVIIAIALNIGYYNSFLSDLLWNTPDQLVATIGADAGTTTAQYLDVLTAKTFDIGSGFFEKARLDSVLGIPDLMQMMMGLLVWAFGFAAIFFAGFLLALSKIALAVLLGVGPIFVLALLFDSTKRFFDLWLGQAINYIILVLLAAATVKLILGILESYLSAISTISGDDLAASHAIPVFALAGIGMLILKQIPQIASALGGGVAVSAMGLNWNPSRGAGNALKNLKRPNLSLGFNKRGTLPPSNIQTREQIQQKWLARRQRTLGGRQRQLPSQPKRLPRQPIQIESKNHRLKGAN